MPKIATVPAPARASARASQSPAVPKPDLVDNVTAYLCALVPEIAQRPEVLEQLQVCLRTEFGGVHGRHYIRAQGALDRMSLLARARAMLKTEAPTTVARQLGISRAQVYRIRAAMAEEGDA